MAFTFKILETLVAMTVETKDFGRKCFLFFYEVAFETVFQPLLQASCELLINLTNALEFYLTWSKINYFLFCQKSYW